MCSWTVACSTNTFRLYNNTCWWPLTPNPTDTGLRLSIRCWEMFNCPPNPQIREKLKHYNGTEMCQMCLCFCLAALVENIWRECVSFKSPLHRRGQKVTVSLRVTAVMERGVIFKSQREEQPSIVWISHILFPYKLLKLSLLIQDYKYFGTLIVKPVAKVGSSFYFSASWNKRMIKYDIKWKHFGQCSRILWYVIKWVHLASRLLLSPVEKFTCLLLLGGGWGAAGGSGK